MVFLDQTGNGRPGSSGVANVEVRISGARSDARRTAGNGFFAFGDLPPGRYQVSVVAPGGYRVTTDAAVTLTVEAQKVAGGANFGLTPGSAPASAPSPARAAPEPVLGPSGSRTNVSPSGSSPPGRVASASPSPAPRVGTSVGETVLGPASASAPSSGQSVIITGEQILAGLGTHWRPADQAGVQAPRNTASAPPSRAAAGVGSARHATPAQAWISERSLWLGVPFKTQIDGSGFAKVNCGPASLAMIFAAFGLDVEPQTIRDYVNYLTGDYNPADGTSLDALAKVAREAGLSSFDLREGDGYRKWTFDRIRDHVRAGHAVITLVKYRTLPGNGTSLSEWDHYIVITGIDGDDLIYNDSAFATNYGFNLLLSRQALERAWSYSSVPNHAVAVGVGDGLRPLANLPAQVMANSMSMEAALAGPEPPVAMLPGAATRWLREQLLLERGTVSELPDAPVVEARFDESAQQLARAEATAAPADPEVVIVRVRRSTLDAARSETVESGQTAGVVPASSAIRPLALAVAAVAVVALLGLCIVALRHRARPVAALTRR
ncbi:MAG: C39 family peptidase [Chloroflexota bacterium]